jgi:hypothetical protein
MPDFYFVSIDKVKNIMLVYMEPTVKDIGIIFEIYIDNLEKSSLSISPVKINVKTLPFKIKNLSKRITIMILNRCMENYKLSPNIIINSNVLQIVDDCMKNSIEEYKEEEASIGLLQLSKIL